MVMQEMQYYHYKQTQTTQMNSDQPYMEFVLDGGTTHSSIGHSSDVFHNDNTDNNTLIIANSVATNDSGSGIVSENRTISRT